MTLKIKVIYSRPYKVEVKIRRAIWQRYLVY